VGGDTSFFGFSATSGTGLAGGTGELAKMWRRRWVNDGKEENFYIRFCFGPRDSCLLWHPAWSGAVAAAARRKVTEGEVGENAKLEVILYCSQARKKNTYTKIQIGLVGGTYYRIFFSFHNAPYMAPRRHLWR